MKKVIELQNIKRDFQVGEETVHALRGVSFTINEGEFVTIMGTSGSGKSTLLKAILGQRSYEGEIDFSTFTGRHEKLRIGYVPQSPAFDKGDPISVLDLFVCCISGRPAFLPVSKKLREQVRACLARVHGEELIDKCVGELSGGELQRVLLALALEPVPHILILDEPLSGVDIEGEHQLLEMLDELRTQYDLSIFLSTHDFATLGQFADKVILLNKRMLRAGPPDEVLSSPEFYDTFHLRMGRGGER